MNNIKLTDKELVLIINALTEKIRYKGVQKLLSNIHNQLFTNGTLMLEEEEKKTNKRNWFDFNKAHQKYLDKLTDTE